MGEPAYIIRSPHTDNPCHPLLEPRSKLIKVLMLHVEYDGVVILRQCGPVGSEGASSLISALDEVLPHPEWIVRIDGVLFARAELVGMVPLDISLACALMVTGREVAELIGIVTGMRRGPVAPGVRLEDVPLGAEGSLVLGPAEVHRVRRGVELAGLRDGWEHPRREGCDAATADLGEVECELNSSAQLYWAEVVVGV